MVKNKILIMLVLFQLISCSNVETDKVVEDNELNTKNFSQNEYNSNVKRFLEAKNIDLNIDVIFLNSTDCKACAMSSFDLILPQLMKSNRKTIILINDSSITSNYRINNKYVKFVCFARAEYEKHHVFHSDPFLYNFKNRINPAHPITEYFIDSLYKTNKY